MPPRLALITGSSGQIGTNLALALRDEGWQILGLDRRPNPWTDAFPTIETDLARPTEDLTAAVEAAGIAVPHIVVHLAANAKVYELVEHPDRALDNVTMTHRVIEFARHRGIPLIFSSTREVYGDIQRYETNELDASISVTESPYSASKISSEAFIYAYARCYGLRYLVFRLSNVYGRYDDDIDRMERVIPLFYRRIRDGHPITIFGRDKVLDFTHVDDCVAGLHAGVSRLLDGTVVNQTFNLARGHGNHLQDVARSFEAALGTAAKITYEQSRLGEVTHYVADITRARDLLNYDPKTSLAEGLAKAAKWYGRTPAQT